MGSYEFNWTGSQVSQLNGAAELEPADDCAVVLVTLFAPQTRFQEKLEGSLRDLVSLRVGVL